MSTPSCKGCWEKVIKIKELAKVQNVKLIDDDQLYNSYHRYHIEEMQFARVCHHNFESYGIVLDPSNSHFEGWKNEVKKIKRYIFL